MEVVAAEAAVEAAVEVAVVVRTSVAFVASAAFEAFPSDYFRASFRVEASSFLAAFPAAWEGISLTAVACWEFAGGFGLFG